MLNSLWLHLAIFAWKFLRYDKAFGVLVSYLGKGGDLAEKAALALFETPEESAVFLMAAITDRPDNTPHMLLLLGDIAEHPDLSLGASEVVKAFFKMVGRVAPELAPVIQEALDKEIF